MPPESELVEIVLDIDLNKEPECQGRDHPRGVQGHAGSAAYMLRTHCRGSIQLCAGRAEYLRRYGAHCQPCDVTVPGDQLILIEL